MQEEVILVDIRDEPLGTMEKMEAHQKALLHRAFSIFIFDRQGNMLLQQRAANKYHSPGLWTNACCSHPRPGETVEQAGLRRLHEELGFVTPISKAFHFTYRAHFENGLTEHEFDHVFTGVYQGTMQLNPQEVSAISWKTIPEIEVSLQQQPEQYTAWFAIAFPLLKKWMEEQEYDATGA